MNTTATSQAIVDARSNGIPSMDTAGYELFRKADFGRRTYEARIAEERGIRDGGKMGSDPSHAAGFKPDEESCCAEGSDPHFPSVPNSYFDILCGIRTATISDRTVTVPAA